MSQASLAELETQLEIAIRLGYVSLQEARSIAEHAESLGKQLYALKKRITQEGKSVTKNRPAFASLTLNRPLTPNS